MTTPTGFLRETRDELKKVTWPTRQEVVRLTMVVIVVSLVVGLFLGALDFSFTKLLGVFYKIKYGWQNSSSANINRSAGKTGWHAQLGKWYIVHTYSGHENKVKKSLQQRIQSLGFEDRIFEIIVPVRNTIKVSQGKKETVKEKIFPGYVLIRMVWMMNHGYWFEPHRE